MSLTPDDEPQPGPRRIPPGTALLVAILLLVPMAALAAVPLYSRTTPQLWGFPFFYWYQFLWIIITPILTYAAYVVIQRARGRR